MRDHMDEVQFVKDTMLCRKIIIGFVPYGQVLHIWQERQALWPLCGRIGHCNPERSVNWGGGICPKCLRKLGYKQVEGGGDT